MRSRNLLQVNDWQRIWNSTWTLIYYCSRHRVVYKLYFLRKSCLLRMCHSHCQCQKTWNIKDHHVKANLLFHIIIMKYISSRGGESGLSFEQVLFSGNFYLLKHWKALEHSGAFWITLEDFGVWSILDCPGALCSGLKCSEHYGALLDALKDLND